MEEKKVETTAKVAEDTQPAKTAEELKTDLKVANEKSETLKKDNEGLTQKAKHWEETASRQGEELGVLRNKPEPTPENEIKDNDPEVVAETKVLMDKDGMDKDTALYNARLLVKSNRRMMNRRMGAETEELIREDWVDGKMKKELFDENQDAIYAEVDKRKLSKVSARANRNIVRECYDTVLKKKAEELRKANEKPDEEKRTDLINAGTPAPGSGAPVKDTEAEKIKDSIKNAGGGSESVFF